MTADELASAVGSAAAQELKNASNRAKHCVDQLNDEQIWSRPDPSLNSIGNLLLHMAGNIRQWIIAGVGGTLDTRNRPAEFAERGPIAKVELLCRLDNALGEAETVLLKLNAAELARIRLIQGWDISGITAIFDSIPHFRGHVQEIVHMTRRQLGDRYKFAFVPATPEQGA